MTRLAAVLAALLVLATAAPATAEPAGADLTVTISFEKPAYFAYEQINAVITVANEGTEPATGVTLHSESNAPFTNMAWGDLDPEGPGATIAPGERIDLTSWVDLFQVVDVVTMSVEVRGPDSEADTTNNTASAAASVTVRRTAFAGTLYGDRDGDKRFDPGEAMSGVQIETDGGTPNTLINTRTDANGHFFVPNVPEGSYPLELGLRAGWQPDETSMALLTVEGGELMIRAVRSSSALRGSITFDKPVYAVGDTVREHITLTNTGTTDLSGVTARCVEGAGPNELSGRGWGDLVHYEAPGVTVRAGETRTFDFTDVVPEGGRLFGFISLTCWFSTAYRYDDGPVAIARAEVPGGRGSTGGVLYADRNLNGLVDPGEGVPDIKVYFVGPGGRIAGRAVTDAVGHFLVSDVPANSYVLRLTGPWRLSEGADVEINVFDGAVMDGRSFSVEPGPTLVDPDAPPPPVSVVVPSPAPPTPQAAPAPHPDRLADTGADVANLIALGFLMVTLGMLLVRRRSTS